MKPLDYMWELTLGKNDAESLDVVHFDALEGALIAIAIILADADLGAQVGEAYARDRHDLYLLFITIWKN